MLAHTPEGFEGRVGHDGAGLSTAQRTHGTHAPSPNHHSVPLPPQKANNGFHLRGLPKSQTDRILLKVTSAAHEVKRGEGVLEGQILSNRIALHF